MKGDCSADFRRSDDLRRETASLATRRVLYREAKRQLTRLVRKRWRGTRAMLRATLKSLLRPRERGFLFRVIRDHAFALALALALATGATVKAAPAVELTDIEAGFGGFVIDGSAESGLAGVGVSGAGDVNGDGLADLIVSASSCSYYSSVVSSYVVFGKAGGAAVELSDVASELGGFLITEQPEPGGGEAAGGPGAGEPSGDDGSGGAHCYYGARAVSGAGDVNGDGLADVIVGEPGTRPDGKAGAGESYVVFGKADGAAVELSDVRAGIGGFVLKGSAEFDYSGQSVSGAGDVNGDGLDDVIVGAPGADPGGESYVVFGKVDGAAVELSDIRAGNGGFVMEGSAGGDRAGSSVSGAGDVDGDGLADVIVGAPGADPDGRYNAGESYVVFGKADGAAVELSDIRAGNGGFVLKAIENFGSVGEIVSGAGDVNGDGLADVVVGASYAAPDGESRAGESYVVFGKADGAAVEFSDVRAGNGGFVMKGSAGGDRAGSSVSGAGDVNGDGLADLIVGAPRADPDGKFIAGESYVVFGKADGAAVELSDVGAGVVGFVFKGLDREDRAGSSVSGAGDVNGDGLADFIIGAPYANESYVVFGGLSPDTDADGLIDPLELFIAGGSGCPDPQSADSDGDELSDAFEWRQRGTDPCNPDSDRDGVSDKFDGISIEARGGTGGFLVRGVNENGSAGVSVSGAGDVNGDGLADFIIGAPYADPDGENSAGESFVVFGKADRAAVELSDIRAGIGGFVLKGSAEGDRVGRNVSGAGDVNGDGLADVIVAGGGWSYVVFGKADVTAVELSDIRLGIGGFIFTDSGIVSGAGDVNGDGLADVIVGEPGASPDDKFHAGESYVVFGKADGAAVELSDIRAGIGGFVLKGSARDDRAGQSVSGAGDVNGDGLADVIVAGGGRSYVVFGKADVTAVELSDIRLGIGGFIFTASGAVSGAGDVNGDGLADVIVAGGGRSYVVFGKADGTAVELSDVRAGIGGFIFTASGAVSGAGDVNGDGLADVIVAGGGESYVVFGKADGAAVGLSDLRSGVGGFVLKGLDDEDNSDQSVSGAGDVNGDGLDDVIVGAPRADPDRRHRAGESHVIFGFIDTDGDGLADQRELAGGGCPDPADPDSDDDGLLDGFEDFESLSDPCNPDTDGDGFRDGIDLSLLVAERDNDGLGNDVELDLAAGGDCPDPDDADSDDDGLLDGLEVLSLGTDPCKTDSDDDGLSDPAEVESVEAVCLSPTDSDSDDDGVLDGLELTTLGSDPCDFDSDDDGLSDGEEIDLAAGGDCPSPIDSDSDDDTISDDFELQVLGTDPCVAEATGDVAPWSSTDIGDTGFPGFALYDGDDLLIVAGGTRFYIGASDRFHFVHQAFTGDVILTARVSDLSPGSVSSVGLMLRESTAANAKHASILFANSGSTHRMQFVSRNNFFTNAPISSGNVTDDWIRIERQGNEFIGYHSDNGILWTELGHIEIDMPEAVFGGVAVTAINDAGNEVVLARVSHLETGAPPPPRFIRGDGNGDGRLNIADPSFIANFLFGVGAATPPSCDAAADANGDGGVNIADPSYIANFLFGIGPAAPPPAPFPDCALVPEEEPLACLGTSGCLE